MPQPTRTADASEGQGGVPHALQPHIGPLDGLRGCAALMVALWHFAEFGVPLYVGQPLGNYGVFLFFVLSGFLMGHLYLFKPFTRPALATYLAARVSRIVPLYYATVVAGWLIGRFVDPGFPFASSTFDLARDLGFVGTVSIFWSVGPEFQFYFLFPVLWWLVSRPAANALRWAMPLGFAVLVAIFYRAEWPGIFVLSKLHIFLAGIALAALRRTLAPAMTPRAVAVAQAGAFAVLVILLLPKDFTGATIYPSGHGDPKFNAYYADFGKLLLLAWVVFAFTFESRIANAVFANGLTRALGRYSFSIYLLHVPVTYLFARAGLFDALPPVLAVPVVLVAVFLLCALSFRLIEEPSRRASRAALAQLFERLLGGFGSRAPGAGLPAR